MLGIKRGQIYQARLDPVEGSEIGKSRPVLIVSNDIDNKYSPVVMVAPITELKDDKVYPTEVAIIPPEGKLKKKSRVCLTQIRVLSKKRFLDKQGKIIKCWGQLTDQAMQNVNEAILIAFGLNP